MAVKNYKFNRTILELKHDQEIDFGDIETEFNRTILELKLAFGSWLHDSRLQNLIVPFWN